MNKLNEIFDAVFCINLARRPDRKEQAIAEFAKHGIDVEFINAIDGKLLPEVNAVSSDHTKVSQGDWGCTQSHLQVVLKAKHYGLRNYFVFEDDVELATDFNDVFPGYYAQVPENWQMLYLGGNHDQPLLPISDNVAKITRTFTTHAIGIDSSMYDKLIEVWSRQEKVDICISDLHSQYNCYVFRPHIAWQKAGYSDILEKVDDYKHLRPDYIKPQ
jgi:GR25 family glycosyltransferase involved in LPS biosynthesis